MTDSFQSPWSLRAAALRECQARFECGHEETAFRERRLGNGGVQYVRQCHRCGKATTNPIKRADAIYQNRSTIPPPFDDALLETWERDKSQAYEQIDRDYRNRVNAFSSPDLNPDDEWQIRYNAYLASPAWTKKRKLVLERANNLCEGCREHAAAEVHHLSYENMSDEFLFELVALCKKCHDSIHERRQARTSTSSG